MEITSGQPTFQLGGNNGAGFCGDGGILFLAFLAMMGMGGFGGWGGNRGCVPNNLATTETVNNAVQFGSLQDQNRDIVTSISAANNDVTQRIGGVYSELQRDIANNALTLANMSQQNSECCCSIKQEIAAQTLNFTQQLAAMNLRQEQQFAALNSRMDQQTIQQLRDEVQNLKSDIRLQGVVRYPTGLTYNAGNSPFCQSTSLCSCSVI